MYRMAPEFCRVRMYLLNPVFIMTRLIYMYNAMTLGGVVQPSAAHIPPEADSLLHSHLHYEVELGCVRLGKGSCMIHIHVYSMCICM